MLGLHPADESLWLSKHVLEYPVLHTAHVAFLLPLVCFRYLCSQVHFLSGGFVRPSSHARARGMTPSREISSRFSRLGKSLSRGLP